MSERYVFIVYRHQRWLDGDTNDELDIEMNRNAKIVLIVTCTAFVCVRALAFTLVPMRSHIISSFSISLQSLTAALPFD